MSLQTILSQLSLRNNMPQLQQSLGRYSVVGGLDHEDEFDIKKPETSISEKPRVSLVWFVSISVICLFCIALGFAGGLSIKSHGIVSNGQVISSPTAGLCKDPSTRREWRTLSRWQKEEYIQAVQCLSTTESNLGLNQTLHDDFPWVHSRIGNYCMSIL